MIRTQRLTRDLSDYRVMVQAGIVAFALAISAPAAAEVTSANAAGFEITASVETDAEPAAAYAALLVPGRWWNGAHSYSGDAANLSLDARPGGCFCERVPATGATIEHGRIVYAQPNAALRLNAALGPLQSEGVSAALTWTIKPGAKGGSTIAMRYVVGGYIPGGAEALAKPVDAVLVEQLNRLKAHLARR